MNETNDRFAEREQLKQNHPTWKGVPVVIIGLHHHHGVLKRCYVRKLNGQSPAWEGWVSVKQIEQQGGTGEGSPQMASTPAPVAGFPKE